MKKPPFSPAARATRRGALRAAFASIGALWLAGCDRLSRDAGFVQVLKSAQALSAGAQRGLAGRRAMAQEFTPADVAAQFRANGTLSPSDAAYRALAANGFRDWALQVDGLVERPTAFSLDQLRAMPARTQITRHDCVEGWSCIGQWTGVPLARILEAVRPLAQARYLVFHCADSMNNGPADSRYYESIDLDDAYHVQTLLAYELNGATLPIRHGAPLRLRVERQLGYKQAKYLMRVELVEDFSALRGGAGGYWEDQGYEWYAGI